ncbi:MAG: DUF1015 domain-containing protein [Methanocella sp.]
MVDIRPFKAITYTPKAGPAEDLITQPYDKIDAEMQKQYYERSPYNFCRLILPVEQDKYNVANQRINLWLKEGVMAKEAQPAFFISRQEFTLNGKRIARTGIIAAVKLHPYSENVVFPHEATFKAPKADRLNMLRTVQKDLEPVFLMYQDPEEKTITYMAEVAKSAPVIEATDSLGVKHTVWKISDPAKVEELRALLAPKVVVINDGHHRYESAILYRDEMRARGNWSEDQAFNYYMCYLVPVQEKGLVVLPTHRLLKQHKLTPDVMDGLKCFFDVVSLEPSIGALEAFLASHVGEHAFCVYDGKKACGLILKHDDAVYEYVEKTVSKETKVFDVVILRDIVFKQVLKTGQLTIDDTILYERLTKDAITKVDRGEASIAFLVNPIKAETVAEVAVQHEVLPEKSTDFYPKLVSGLVLMDISPSEKL